MPGCSGGHTGLGKARLEAVSKSSGVSGDHFCAVRDENSVVGGVRVGHWTPFEFNLLYHL